jgi:hypothetical protein
MGYRKMVIEVDGLRFVAGLVEVEALLMYGAFLSILPYKGVVVHLK